MSTNKCFSIHIINLTSANVRFKLKCIPYTFLKYSFEIWSFQAIKYIIWHTHIKRKGDISQKKTNYHSVRKLDAKKLKYVRYSNQEEGELRYTKLNENYKSIWNVLNYIILRCLPTDQILTGIKTRLTQ